MGSRSSINRYFYGTGSGVLSGQPNRSAHEEEEGSFWKTKEPFRGKKVSKVTAVL